MYRRDSVSAGFGPKPPVHEKFERMGFNGPQMFPPPSANPPNGLRYGPSAVPKSLPWSTLPVTCPGMTIANLATGATLPGQPGAGLRKRFPMNWFPVKSAGGVVDPQLLPTSSPTNTNSGAIDTVLPRRVSPLQLVHQYEPRPAWPTFEMVLFASVTFCTMPTPSIPMS